MSNLSDLFPDGAGMTIGARQTISSSQTLNRSALEALAPAGMVLAGAIFKPLAGGGGGAFGTDGTNGGWGGEAPPAEFFTYEEIGTSIALTVGAGGAGGTSGVAPTAGGDTAVGDLMRAFGGPAGISNPNGRISPSRYLVISDIATYTWFWGAGGSSGAQGFGSRGDFGGGGCGKPAYSGQGLTGGVVRRIFAQAAGMALNSGKWLYGANYQGGAASATEGLAGHAGVGDLPGGGGNPKFGGIGGDGGFPSGGGAWGETTRGGNGGAGVIYIYPVFKKA